MSNAKVSVPAVGKTYSVSHTRKGRFTMKVTSVNDTWVTGNLVSGEVQLMSAGASVELGEELTVRLEFCQFTEVSGDVPAAVE